jgi:hypothetical protein
MYSIKLDVQDNIFDNVMYFLNNIPNNDIKIKEIHNLKSTQNDDLVSFFRTSPLIDEIVLDRSAEQYNNKVEF